MFSLESPHHEYTQYTIFNIKKKITLNSSKSELWDFFQEIQERVRKSHGKRATTVLLYKDN